MLENYGDCEVSFICHVNIAVAERCFASDSTHFQSVMVKRSVVSHQLESSLHRSQTSRANAVCTLASRIFIDAVNVFTTVIFPCLIGFDRCRGVAQWILQPRTGHGRWGHSEGCMWYRADSRFAPSQWETVLLCNDVSHWLGAILESVLWYLSAYNSQWLTCYG